MILEILHVETSHKPEGLANVFRRPYRRCSQLHDRLLNLSRAQQLAITRDTTSINRAHRPRWSTEARVALTLRLLGGLTILLSGDASYDVLARSYRP